MDEFRQSVCLESIQIGLLACPDVGYGQKCLNGVHPNRTSRLLGWNARGRSHPSHPSSHKTKPSSKKKQPRQPCKPDKNKNRAAAHSCSRPVFLVDLHGCLGCFFAAWLGFVAAWFGFVAAWMRSAPSFPSEQARSPIWMDSIQTLLPIPYIRTGEKPYLDGLHSDISAQTLHPDRQEALFGWTPGKHFA